MNEESTGGFSGKRGICLNFITNARFTLESEVVGEGRYPDSRRWLLSAPSRPLIPWEQWLLADFPLQRACMAIFPLKS